MALGEMRAVVSALRDDGEQPSLTPQPSVADLPALIAAAGTTATRVRLVVEGSPRPLTAGLDLAAYRIIQEALTNAHRHARATEVRVLLVYEPAGMRIEVHDDGVGQAVGPSGHGLIECANEPLCTAARSSSPPVMASLSAPGCRWRDRRDHGVGR